MTRREAFDRLVADVVAELTRRWPAVSTIEFAVEDVPPSAPAPWEDHGVVTARIFPADRRRGLSDRIVVYRLSVLRRCSSEELPQFLLQLLAERISHLLVIDPDDLDELLG
ncbi:metallopeptidase family protein [Schaalia suimastitidis]|uniref:metallopeptidase family protein n=1 Tax=Schaalia suimastitidis TaxID=121163 RepID=UPI0004007AB8|nr:metallopeptidase family protein [Schaalia suimastitidis]